MNDFVILDMEADEDVPIILEQPFLSTSDFLVEVSVEARYFDDAKGSSASQVLFKTRIQESKKIKIYDQVDL